VALAAGTEFAVPARTITTAPVSSITASGAKRQTETVTITTAAAHGLNSSDGVVISGVDDASFDGTFVVDTVPSTTTFTYAQTGADATSGNGQATFIASLNEVAGDAQTSVAALAVANQDKTNILTAGSQLVVGTQTYTVRTPPPAATIVAGTGAARSNGTVTITTTAAHGLNPADSVVIAGVADASFDGTFVVATVGSTTTFTYAQAGADATSGNGQATYIASLSAGAAALGVTVGQLAAANQYVQSLLVPSSQLTVDTIVARDGSTLGGLAAQVGQTVDQFVGNSGNAAIQNLFATGTAIRVGMNSQAKPPQATDTLLTFAQNNGVTLQDLAAFNAGASLVAGATVDIPSVLLNPSPGTDTPLQYCTYLAGGSDTVAGIAAKFGVQAAAITALNAGIPGLMQGQNVIANSLWICPQMRGDGGTPPTDGSLNALAGRYNTTTLTLATANAAVLSFLASGVTLTIGSITLPPTTDYDTFNSLISRANQATGSPGNFALADVVEAVAGVQGLVRANARVLPVPPPLILQQVTIKPSFTKPWFQVAVNVVTTRNPKLVDPAFTSIASVCTSTYAVPVVHGSGSDGQALALTEFATAFQQAFANVHVATGESDTADYDTPIWAVNFGSSFGPALGYQFDAGADARYFAIPPMSTSLMSGVVPVRAYTSGQGLAQVGAPTSFSAIDLDAWFAKFLQTVDLFLSPAQALPAYDINPTAVTDIIQDKRTLAGLISQRILPVLQKQGGGEDTTGIQDAIGAMYQALLQQLGSAYSVDTIVQVPVTVTSTYDAQSAPRLSGKIIINQGSNSNAPNAFSFSTAKVPLAKGPATANFLFSAKAPAAQKNAQLDLDYAVTELELPEPGAVIADYTGSSWLKFVLPLDDSASHIGPAVIPIPLRSYPGPVILLEQEADQSVQSPKSAADLLPWDFDFAYQHDDAEQDTPFVTIAFNPGNAGIRLPWMAQAASSNMNLTAIFAALGQFMAVLPALQDDLASLALLAPNTGAAKANATSVAAIATMQTLVDGVVTAWQQTKLRILGAPPAETYCYEIDRQQEQHSQFLTLTFIDPATGVPTPNTNAKPPMNAWPDIFVQYEGSNLPLLRGTHDATHAVYQYPSKVPLGAHLAQYFYFHQNGAAPTIQWPQNASAPQVFDVGSPNIFARETGQAAVSIARNLSLVEKRATVPAFVYRTAPTSFPRPVEAANYAGAPIAIGASPTPVAQALGGFLQALMPTTMQGTVGIRFAAVYDFDLAQSQNGNGSALDAAVPILLVPWYDFNPAVDSDPGNPNSFVSQVQEAVLDWGKQNSPAGTHASYQFELIIYASDGLHPLIEAARLEYALN
jgi:LysM repeat protein